MRELVEFRVPETNARLFLKRDLGEHLGDSVRAVTVATDDPVYERIGRLTRLFDRCKCAFYHGWEIRREYSRAELEAGKLFRLIITSAFEPVGEECGTIYDEATACTVCHAGRRQVSELVLDLRTAPKSKQIARTIADEWVVSQPLADLLVDARATGFELRPVRQRARYDDDPIKLEDYPGGRELLNRATAAGIDREDWRFSVWLNRTEQDPLWQQALRERAESLRLEARRQPKVPVWYQLVPGPSRITVVPPSHFGIKPFLDDAKGEYRCPLGHILGLNLLSELWVDRRTWDGSDFACTEQMEGARMGVLVPAPLILISPRLRRLLVAEKIKGCEIEVAHLAD